MKSTFRAAKRSLTQFLQDRFFYTTFAAWEERFITHFSWTRRAALSWAACYPASALVTISRAPGVIVARRGHLN